MAQATTSNIGDMLRAAVAGGGERDDHVTAGADMFKVSVRVALRGETKTSKQKQASKALILTLPCLVLAIQNLNPN